MNHTILYGATGYYSVWQINIIDFFCYSNGPIQLAVRQLFSAR